MNRADLRDFENKLLEWRVTLEQQLRSAGETPGDPDPLARQSEEMAESLDSLWHQAVVAQTREIDLALRKIHEGVFGSCEQCGKPISPKRLEVIPWARKCFPCQSALPEQRASLASYFKSASSGWYSPSR